MKNITDADVDQYVEENAELTALERIQNMMSLITNGIDWRLTTQLANAAFIVLAAGQFIKGIGSLVELGSDLKKFGGLGKLLTDKLGFGSKLAGSTELTGKEVEALNSGTSKAGSALGGLATGAAVVGLTAATIGTLASISNRAQDDAVSNQYKENFNSLKGTKNEGNKSYASALSIASGSNSTSDFAKSFSNVGAGFNNLFTIWTTKDKTSLNKATTEWMFRSGVLDDVKKVMAWAIILDQVGNLDVLNSVTNTSFSHSDLSRYFSSGAYEDDNIWDYIAGMFKAGWHPAKDNQGNRMTSYDEFRNNWKDTYTVDGYKKAGLDRVPKDNYHALLHKNEMVLNERQANQYRKLFNTKNYGFGGSLNSNAADYVGPHHSGYAGHNGIDLYFGDIGTPVGSAVSGRVLDSYDIPVNWSDGRSYHGKDTNGVAYSSYGRVVKVLGDDGHTYIYAHLNERKVNTGDIVSPGTLLGYSGTTGNSSGPHLHFEVAGAGTGEAAHAKYYTPYVRNVTGSASSSSNTSSTSSSNMSAVSTLGSRRYISGAITGGIGGGNEGASRIVNSVDGGFNRLLQYLDSISREQNEQRALLETYSISKNNSPSFS